MQKTTDEVKKTKVLVEAHLTWKGYVMLGDPESEFEAQLQLMNQLCRLRITRVFVNRMRLA